MIWHVAYLKNNKKKSCRQHFYLFKASIFSSILSASCKARRQSLVANRKCISSCDFGFSISNQSGVKFSYWSSAMQQWWHWQRVVSGLPVIGSTFRSFFRSFRNFVHFPDRRKSLLCLASWVIFPVAFFIYKVVPEV